MSIKRFIKTVVGCLLCLKFHVKHEKNVYIGYHTNIQGRGNVEIHKGAVIRPYVNLWSNTGRLVIGEGTEIGERSRISCQNEIKLGDYVLVSPNVYITDCDHEYRNVQVPVIKQGVVKRQSRVFIDDGAYIGINTVIVGNVHIGKGAVIGANSVVTKDVGDYSVAVGSPAQVIKKYNEKIYEWESV